MEVKKVAVFVANDSEDIETVVPLDLLRRAGLNVSLVSLENTKQIKLASGLSVTCDTLVKDEEFEKYNALVFPGGTGILEVNEKNVESLKNFCVTNTDNKNYLFCANCIAPTKLVEWGMFDNKNTKLTCYPSPELTSKLGSHYVNQRVVIEDNCITAAGPGCSSAFSFAIVEKLLGKEVTEKLKKDTIFN